MRKLARQAVIFALLGSVVGGAVLVSLQYHDKQEEWKRWRETAPIDLSAGLVPKQPSPTTQKPFDPSTFGAVPVDDTYREEKIAHEAAKPSPISAIEWAGLFALGLPYGFVGGLGLWVLYRLVRFAVKG